MRKYIKHCIWLHRCPNGITITSLRCGVTKGNFDKPLPQSTRVRQWPSPYVEYTPQIRSPWERDAYLTKQFNYDSFNATEPQITCNCWRDDLSFRLRIYSSLTEVDIESCGLWFRWCSRGSTGGFAVVHRSLRRTLRILNGVRFGHASIDSVTIRICEIKHHLWMDGRW